MSVSTASGRGRGTARRGRGKVNISSLASRAQSGRNRAHVLQEQRQTTVISIDYGTSTFSACCAVKHGDKPVELEDIDVVEFKEEASEHGTMVAAWHEGIFHFGYDLTTKKVSGAVPAHKLITGFKLLLYDRKQYRTSERVSRVRTRLQEAGKSVDDLSAHALKSIWDGIFSWAAERDVTIDRASTVVYLPVPLIVTPDATTTMSKAAMKAGLPRVRFVYEPLCAGVSILKTLLERTFTEEAYAPYRGCNVLSLDMGGGTTDLVSLRLPKRLEDAKHNKLVVLGKDGIMCGGTDVDESFRQWLKEHIRVYKGGMKAFEGRMLLSEEGIMNQAVGGIEEWKNDPDRADRLEIGCSRTRDRIHEEFQLTPDLMRSFLDPHIGKVVALANANRTENTKYIILSGGFVQSNYVFKTIKDSFEGSGIVVMKSRLRYKGDCPVAKGALMVDDKLDQSTNTSTQSVGLLYFEEDVDPKLHPDAYDDDGNLVKFKGRWRKVVYKDKVYSEARKNISYTVRDRVRWLIKKGARADRNGNFTSTSPVMQQFFVPVDIPTVSHTVVFAARDAKPYHEPFRDDRGYILPGFAYRTEETTLSEDFIKRCRDYGRSIWLPDPAKKSTQKKEHLEVACAFGLRYDSMSIEMIRQFVKPQAFPHTSSETWVDEVQGVLEYDEAQWENVFDTNFDHEIVDTSLPDFEAPIIETNNEPQEIRRSPTLQALPQPQQQALGQGYRPPVQTVPHSTTHGPSQESPPNQSQDKLQSPPQGKGAGKKRRREMEDVDPNTTRQTAARVSPTVPYQCTPFGDDDEDDAQPGPSRTIWDVPSD